MTDDPEPKRRKRPDAPTREEASAGPTDAHLNGIEQGRTQRAQRPQKAANKSVAAAEAPPKESPARAMPDEIRERFIGIGANYYFPDGVTAFTDHGTKLSTRSENTEVIRSLVAIAQAREWGEIRVTGTERFRKEAWFAARIAGLEVKGYTPTEFEQERVVRAIARREAGREDGAAGREPNGTAAEREDRSAGRQHSARVPEEQGPITGRLVDHGRANYKHNPKETMSYYVRIETSRGDREIWGVDLERAFRESLSRPTIGDEVTARSDGHDPVTVSAARRDAEGRVAGKKEIATHQNRWIVERSDFLAERSAAAETFRDAAIRASDGVKAHPELQGSYLQLQAAKLGAERDIRDPKDREHFVSRARAAIAAAIERGEPLEPVRLRERPRTPEPEKSQTPEQTPTR